MQTTTKQRIAWGVLITALLFVAGAAGGMIVGVRLVPPGSGLAGPAIAIGYGILMATGGLVVGLTLGLRARLSWMPRISAWIAVAALILIAALVLDVRQRQAARDASREASGLDEQRDSRPLRQRPVSPEARPVTEPSDQP